MLKRHQRYFYALGRFGSQVLLTFIDLAAFWVYIDMFNLHPLLSAVGFAVGKLVIAIAGPLTGYLSDVTWLKRLGRRKPFFLIGAPGLAISCALAFVPTWFVAPGNQLGLFLYMLGTMSFFNLFYALLMTPYQAWMPEITEPSERVMVSTYQNSFWLLGQIVGTIGGFALPMLLPLGLNIVFAIVAGLGVVEIFTFLPAFFSLQERKEDFVPQPGLRLGFRRLLENQNYRSYLLLRGTMAVPTSLLGRLLLGYTSDVLGLVDLEFILMALLLLGVTFIFYFVWTWLSHRPGGKRIPLLLSLLVLLAVLPCTLLIGQSVLIAMPTTIQGTIFIGLIAAGVSGWYLLPNPITADIIDEDEQRTAEARAGGYEGFINLPLNVFQVGATLLAGLLMSLPPALPNAYSLGLLWWGPVAAVFVAINIPLIFWRLETDPLNQ